MYTKNDKTTRNIAADSTRICKSNTWNGIENVQSIPGEKKIENIKIIQLKETEIKESDQAQLY